MSYAAIPLYRTSFGSLLSAAISSPPAADGPFSVFVKGGDVPNEGGAGPEGQLAVSVMGDVLNGRPIPIQETAKQAGAIAGGVAGLYFGPLGGALGSVIGGAVGKAVGGLIGGSGDDCDAACGASRDLPGLAANLCTHRDGRIDAACKDAVYWATRNKYDCFFEARGFHIGNQAGCQAIVAAWKQPLTVDGNERSYQARLGAAAAAVRLQDDIEWARNIINTANATANKYGPQCVGNDICIHTVKAQAIQYARNKYPFHEKDENNVAADSALVELDAAVYAASHQAAKDTAQDKEIAAQKAAQKAAQARQVAATAAQATAGMYASMSAAAKKKKYMIIGAVGITALVVAAVILTD